MKRTITFLASTLIATLLPVAGVQADSHDPVDAMTSLDDSPYDPADTNTLFATENYYQWEGLPRASAGPVTGTITVDGTAPVCSMTDKATGVTRTSPPWQFQLVPDVLTAVEITECSGARETIDHEVLPLAKVSGTLHDPAAGPWRVSLRVYYPGPYSARISDSSGTVLTRLPELDDPRDPLVIPDAIAGSARKLSLTLAGGEEISWQLVRMVGWSSDEDTLDGARQFPNCDTITWRYDAAGRPSTARRMPKDIRAGLKRLTRVTGLRFTPASAGSAPDIIFNWKRLAESNPAAIASSFKRDGRTAGIVVLNSRSPWTNDDRLAGLGRPRDGSGRSAGRGWIIVHEVMHVLGFKHVEDPLSIMVAYNTGQAKFSRGDRAGLRTLYPRSACRR